MFFHVLLDGGERSSSLTGLGSTSDIIIQMRGWVDHRGGFDAVKRGFARSGKRNNYSAVVQLVSWSHYGKERGGNSITDESNVWEESSDRDKTDTVKCSCMSVCYTREITPCVDRAASWIWEKAPVSIQAIYGYVKICLFCAATDRGRSYCLCVTDGVNCLTASLAYNRYGIKMRQKNWRESNFIWNNTIIIIFINCNWVFTRCQWLFYIYTEYEIGCYWI